MNEVVEVRLWGTTIGHLGYSPGQKEYATFQFDNNFLKLNIQPSPLVMKYQPVIHEFPDISRRTFHGLPGIFADSLPDRFGSQLIDMYMAEQGIPAGEVTALDRLLYMGTRGMGALEYHPAAQFIDSEAKDTALDIRMLAELSGMVLSGKHKRQLLSSENRLQALKLIRVGSSAGGARSKALITKTSNGNFIDGTGTETPEASHWLLKFDSGQNIDREDRDPSGMTRVEYIYAAIARKCGINIPDTDFIEDSGLFHFMIKRFDRTQNAKDTEKLFYASWAGLAHVDRDTTGTYSYEQLILAARQLGIGQDGINELFRRAVFNIIGRNQDDHSKNFGFMMDREGKFSVSPAFDLTYANDASGQWTRMHQLRLNGRQTDFSKSDIQSFGRYCSLTEKQSQRVIEKTTEAFKTFNTLAKEFEVPVELSKTVEMNIRNL